MRTSLSHKSEPGASAPQPAPDFLFSPMPKMIGSMPGLVSGLAKSKHVSEKCEQIELPLQELALLNLELGMYTMTTVSATNSPICVAVLCTQAGASTRAGLQQLLDNVKLSRFGSELVVSTPLVAEMATMTNCRFNVTAAPTCPFNIRGCFSQVEILDMAAPLTVSLSYGSVSLLGTSGDADVQTGPGGGIIFASHRGRVVLKSAGEINIKITDQFFAGSLQAYSRDMPVRVLIPPGFRSAFEVVAPELICRADIASQVHQLKESDGRIIAHYGSGHECTLRFQSVRGAVVIDNTNH